MDTEAYDEVQSAYETLISPEKRSVYDAGLEATFSELAATPASKKGGTVPLRRSNAGQQSSDGSAPDSTKAFMSVICPICTQQNSVGDKYCIECGFLLSSTPSEVIVQPMIAGSNAPRLESAAGTKQIVKPGLNRVGREHADILVSDKTVSRYHALVVFDEERNLLSVEDAGSSNGTRVNEFVLPPRSSHPLNDGDEITFGTAKFKVFAGVPAPVVEKSAEENQNHKEITVTLPPLETTPTARLTLQRGRGPQEVLLTPGTITIGRLPDNHVSLPGDRYASGHHAQVVVEETVFRLIDVGSTNGSFLNGLRLTTNESIAMSDGDELMIGSTVFQFQVIKKKSAAEHDSEADDLSELGSAEEPIIPDSA
jgi:pSer/pThr/pTyr-binding forkhead associated (FHA) protein